LEGVPVVVLRGRVHFYEGYSLQQITFPVRTLRRLGAELLIITNAAGGLNPAYQPGDLMALRDHINLPGLAGQNPLIGSDEPELGVRFLDMTDPYDAALRARALELGAEQGVRIHEGVYVAVAGPSFETRAELRYLRMIGADAVGMSTVPEVIVARHERMSVLGISVVTNTADPDAVVADVSHEGVLRVAEQAGTELAAIVRGVLRSLNDAPADAGG
jgi:purine-nucleoside phosphorylase